MNAFTFALIMILFLDLVIIALVWAFAIQQQRHSDAADELRAETTDLADQRNLARVEALNNANAVTHTLLNVTPLLEQTDWMTGRWGGKFDELVRLENARNAATVKVRRRLMDSPAIKEHARKHPTDVIPTLNGLPL